MRPWEGLHYRGLLGGEVNSKECRVYKECIGLQSYRGRSIAKKSK